MGDCVESFIWTFSEIITQLTVSYLYILYCKNFWIRQSKSPWNFMQFYCQEKCIFNETSKLTFFENKILIKKIHIGRLLSSFTFFSLRTFISFSSLLTELLNFLIPP